MKKLRFSFVSIAILSGSIACSNSKQGHDDLLSSEKNESEPIIQTTTETHVHAGYVDLTYAAETSVNAVVHVMTKIETQGKYAYQDPWYNFFFGENERAQKPRTQISSGSGVILSSDGYIVTNNHVIANANSISVILNDKRSFDAKLVGTDPNTDIALLKIDAEGLPTLNVGNSDNLRIGEWVLAVGNPFNLSTTVTAGIVSAKARSINILDSDMKIESFIQTDAAVNPGNSGGALVNTKGELVGINTAIASQTGSYAGYSFAVPVSIMAKVVEDLKKYGMVQRALLGISIADITSDFAQKNGLNTLEGAYVAAVGKNSAADEAGIMQGDIIIAAKGIKVKSVSELQEIIGRLSPGDNVEISVLRNGKMKSYNVLLKNRIGTTDVIKNDESNIVGAKLRPLNEAQKMQLNVNNGLIVESIDNGSIFDKANIPVGYIIIKANSKPIYSISDLNAVIKAAHNSGEKEIYLSGYNRYGQVEYYSIKP